MGPTLEQESNVDQEIIKRKFGEWDQILEAKGRDPNKDEIEYASKVLYLFYDREGDPDSLFRADEISIYKLNISPESFFWIDDLESEADEEWIVIEISPKDPYRSKIGIFSQSESVTKDPPPIAYYAQSQEILVSNKGRALERTTWEQDSFGWKEPIIAKFTSPNIKQKPTESQSIILDQPLEEENPVWENFKGQTLERLNFIHEQIKTGNMEGE